MAEPAGGGTGTPVRFQLPRVHQRNLSDEVYGILGQEIPAGTRLLEAELGTQLNVSRAPIREALRKLEHEGLVESFPRRGAIVVSVPEDEIQTFYRLRAEIEATAFARACERLTDADLTRLDALVAALQAAYDRGDVDGVLDADLAFHAAVMDISGLTILRRAWSAFDGPLRLRAYQLMEADPAPDKALVESAEHPHAVLLEALRARDTEAAAREVRAHILEVSDLYRDAVAARGDQLKDGS